MANKAEEPQDPIVNDPEPMSDRQFDRITNETAKALAAQPKVKVRLYQVPPGSTEKPLPDETVQVNGFIYQIQRGVEVKVPQTVAEILEQAGRR